MEYGSQVQSNLGEQQLAAFNEFLSKHDRLLSELRSQNETETTFSKDSIPRLERTQFRPIHVQFDTSECENISIFQLIDSENKVLNKLLVVFADLCMEARKLRKSYMNYNVGYLCVDDDLAEMEVNGVDSMQFLAKFSEHFEFFNNIKCYLQRCILVANNIIKQLSALFVEEKFYTNVQGSLHFQSAFDALADLILILISFDEIISSSYIVKNWTHCKKVLTTLTTFENEDPLDGLEMVLNDFEYLFSCCFYQSLTDGTFGLTQVADKKSLVTFACHFISYIKNNLALLLQSPNSPENNKIEMTESDEISLLVKLNGMIVLYHNMFGNLDVKYVKQLIECNIKRCDITLTGSIIWQPEIFFQRHASTLIKKIGNHLFTEKDLKRVRLNQLQAHGQSLSKNTQLYAMQVVLWNLKIMELPKSNSPSVKFDDVKEKFYLLLEGLQIASKISQLVCSVTNLHTFLKSPMQKSYLNDLCRLIEFLKTIKTTYDKNLCAIQRITTTITQYFMYQILHIVVAKRKKLTLPGSQKGANNKTERLCDILSALQLVERCLHGPATIARLLVARLALCASDPNSTFTIEQLKKLVKLFHRLEWIVDFQSKIDTICSTNFLYWHQMIISFYLKQLVTKDQPVVNCSISDKLLTMVHSAIDCEESMAVIKRNYPAILSDNFKNNIEYEQSLVNEIKAEITSKLCAEVETQLRLESYLRIQERYDNNDGKSASLKPQLNDAIDIHSYFPLPIIQFGKKHVSIQNNIENYLSKMFYNLTTVSLHNWRTYGDMRHLARLKYSLITVEDYLPNQTLEQGLDVLEIMRNIHIFVSKYCYNLNNQIFVERTSNNKHLNTISIPHIANSLRTHGTGIINTTVNFTYQFLRKKFSIFSQFLYDEQIKSRLIKDLKYFRSNADKISQTYYPYDRACTFNRSIRRLGLDDKGQSYLDLYRILITQIGNAVGYVRMMQSGVVNCCSTASFYLPPLEEGFLNPEEYKEFDENTVIAINNLRNTINHLLNINTFDKREDSSSIKNGSNVGSQETKKSLNYLKILVDVFIPVMRNSKNVHLKLFYLILPPLIVNYVEYMIVMKHKLNKKVLTRMIESKGSQGDKDEVIFTEDGFAMGLVYILKLLDQTEDFNSLHWFKSVKQMYNEKLRQTQEESKELAKGGSHQDATKLQETMHLTQKRIQTFQQEYDLLFYNLSSAKIFFQ